MFIISEKTQVLMSTYNGEKYLKSQISSIINQKNTKTHLLIRDDGSKDSTPIELKKLNKLYDFDVYFGDNIGYGSSFLNLIYKSGDYNYYAFSDQDDVWKTLKISRAISLIKKYPKNIPICYFSSLLETDQNLKVIKKKNFDNMKISLGSALVRHRVAGCTIVMNQKLANIIKSQKVQFNDKRISHDSFVFLLTLAIGGKVTYDEKAYILYRRHNNSVTVAGKGILKRIIYEMKLFNKNKNKRENLCKLILSQYNRHIAKDKLPLLIEASNYRKSISKTLKFMFNKKLRSGLKIADIIARIAILIRYF